MSSVMAPLLVEKYPLPQKIGSPRTAFLQLRKFPLHLVRPAPFHQPYKVAHHQFRWRRHEHMHMVARQDAAKDIDVVFVADLPDDVAHPQPDIAKQHFVSVLRRPDQMIPRIKDAMLASGILHDFIL
jgi:hypothetical protein